MKKTTRRLILWGLTSVVVAAAVGASFVWGVKCLIVPVVLVPFLLLRARSSRQRQKPEHRRPATATRANREAAARPHPAPPVRPVMPAEDPNDPGYLARRMLRQNRYALLLRPQIAGTLHRDQLHAAILALDDAMGIVPEGDVLLQSWRNTRDADDFDAQRDRLVRVEAIYLDRYPVSNRQYQLFVEDGGYENMPLWDPTIWPAVLDFVDRTGHPGPRFWTEGQHPEGLEDHPVVGVSWYEAAAYARWAGKRLPSDPEWVKAGCWPVLTQGTRPMQRRYPWGDTMDRELAHLWGSGAGTTVSVYELSTGVSVGGIYHLIGNVWEWTTSNFGVWDTTTRKLETTTPMKSVRGGAFDTYFETQAMCQFQSGDSPINRKHNIGFRCAVAMHDVISTDLDDSQDHGAEELVSCGAEREE